MKTKSLIPAVLTWTLSLSALSSMAATNFNPLGDPAPAAAANRTIVITPATKYVNVEGGQTVKFVVGGKTFTWFFNGSANVQRFDLNQVAPPGLLDHVVTAYVSVNPLYIGK